MPNDDYTLGSMPWTCLGDPFCAAGGGDPNGDPEYQGGLYGPYYGTGYVPDPPYQGGGGYGGGGGGTNTGGGTTAGGQPLPVGTITRGDPAQHARPFPGAKMPDGPVSAALTPIIAGIDNKTLLIGAGILALVILTKGK